MRKVILPIVTLAAMVSWGCAAQRASADGAQVAHPVRKVHQAYRADCVAFHRCGCPFASTPCYSIYGRYGPYGGSAYWSRFTYGGWFR
jgi:hypothetical protein